jgi:hypothetical protein
LVLSLVDKSNGKSVHAAMGIRRCRMKNRAPIR